MTVVEYKLIDTGDCEKYFDNANDARKWVYGVGLDYFDYVQAYDDEEGFIDF